MSDIHTFKEIFVEVEGIKYYLKIIGMGKPIICLHGFSEEHSTWKDLRLPGYALYCMDLIGHGRSDRIEASAYYEPDIMVEHLHFIIQELGLANYCLMGYSMGGRIALAYTLRYRDEVKHLILESTALGIRDETKRTERYWQDYRLAEKIMGNDIAWFERYWSGLEIFQTQKNLPKTVQEEIKKRRLQNSKRPLANTLLKCGQGVFRSYESEVAGLSMPLLFLAGELDEKYVRVGKMLARQNQNTMFTAVKDAGHNVHLEQPDIYQQYVESFLQKGF